MSWFSPLLLTYDDRNPHASYAASSFGGGMRLAPGAGLGSAQASAQWAWSDTPARAQPDAAPARVAERQAKRQAEREGACLRAPVEVLSRMSEAARALGRSESDIWVEAARDWLRRHEIEPMTLPSAPAPALGAPQSAASRRMARMWDDIDTLLGELRAPMAQHSHEGAPAA